MENFDQRVIKLIVVGEASVGKTSILNQWIHKTFSKVTAPTIGAGMIPIQMNVDGKNYPIHVWDTAGTPQYQSVVPMFVRDTNIALLVFDVTKKNTFEKIHDWYNFVHENSNPSFILVGNKIDLDEREITQQMAVQLSEKLKTDYYETSSATREGIEEMKNGICQTISMMCSADLSCQLTNRFPNQSIKPNGKCNC